MRDIPWTITAEDLADGAPLGDALMALNTAHEAALSPLNPDGLRRLVAQAFVAASVGDGDALLIAFDQGADYDSPNFLWFRDRFERFVYIDRIVVAPHARGRGLARNLYQHLFDRARQAGHDRIACEVNSTPPNPGSDAFHEALGFIEVGAGSIGGGSKTVRYLMRGVEGG